MWAVVKVNKKKINFFKEDFSKNFDKNFKVYIPKIRIENFNKKKIVNNKASEISILGDYIFCFHEAFRLPGKINLIKKFRGLKLLLSGFIENQKEIINFIEKCKTHEDENGYLLQNFFETEINKSYKFVCGPFSQKIFSIIGLEKNKLQALIGNLKTTIVKKEFFFKPI